MLKKVIFLLVILLALVVVVTIKARKKQDTYDIAQEMAIKKRMVIKAFSKLAGTLILGSQTNMPQKSSKKGKVKLKGYTIEMGKMSNNATCLAKSMG